ncbi:hypothetical protein FSP39_002789 [Pinctada imbricata]|uniref:Amine oxidase n=1 Tax=Pinctada imbricata TaxID=66713 RepID=A0AA88YBP0_PINIB|nr:hypothetical protein FSP39_002789 [Pinctada imbricata]
MVSDRSTTSCRRWRCCALFLLSVLIALVATLTVLIIHYDIILSTRKDDKISPHASLIDNMLEEPKIPSVFHDLTHDETKAIVQYLLTTREFNLQDNTIAKPNDSFLYFAELYLPNKSAALDHLDIGHKAPPREAKVVLLRGDKSPPVVEEYAVGPLPQIIGHRLLVSKHYGKSAPYLYRPMTDVEYKEVQRLLRKIDKDLKLVLQESYDSSFFDCENKCLVMKYYTSVTPVSSGTNRRLIWFLAHHDVEYFMLNPVDFAVLFNTDGNDASEYSIDRIWYAGQDFATTDHLLFLYKTESITKSFFPFPEDETEHFSYSTLRGTQFPFKNYRSPKEILPDGQRFTVKDGRVTYMNWAFHFRMSSQNGPQLFDIRHNSNRIIYELSLQEIAVFHSGYQPWVRFSNILQSSRLIGVHSKSLIQGVDCPNYALFLHYHHLHQNLNRSTNKNSVCIFERLEWISTKTAFHFLQGRS